MWFSTLLRLISESPTPAKSNMTMFEDVYILFKKIGIVQCYFVVFRGVNFQPSTAFIELGLCRKKNGKKNTLVESVIQSGQFIINP